MPNGWYTDGRLPGNLVAAVAQDVEPVIYPVPAPVYMLNYPWTYFDMNAELPPSEVVCVRILDEVLGYRKKSTCMNVTE